MTSSGFGGSSRMVLGEYVSVTVVPTRPTRARAFWRALKEFRAANGFVLTVGGLEGILWESTLGSEVMPPVRAATWVLMSCWMDCTVDCELLSASFTARVRGVGGKGEVSSMLEASSGCPGTRL